MLTNWFRGLRKLVRGQHNAKTVRLKSRRASKLGVETLEDRVVPTTTLLLDFGQQLPAGGLATTVAGFRDIVGANHGPDLTSGTISLPTTTNLRLVPLNYDFNGDSKVDANDLGTFAMRFCPSCSVPSSRLILTSKLRARRVWGISKRRSTPTAGPWRASSMRTFLLVRSRRPITRASRSHSVRI